MCKVCCVTGTFKEGNQDEERNARVNITRFLRTQLRKRQAVRVLNQTLKRKDETIGKLKRKDAGCEIDELRKKHSCEIKRVNRRCRTLEKKAEIASTSFDELTTEADVARTQSKDEMNEKDNVISYLEDANQSLQTRVEASESDTASLIAAIFQSDSRTYSVPTRLMVYDLVMNQVPTHNIPSVLDQVIKRTGAKLDRIPHRNTVEMMVREMGVITELQTAEESL